MMPYDACHAGAARELFSMQRHFMRRRYAALLLRHVFRYYATPHITTRRCA